MIPTRYNLDNFKRVVRNPSLLMKEFRWLHTKAGRGMYLPVRKVNNFIFREKYGNGIDVMSQDWDNLILLDACRFDHFEEVNMIDGDLNQVVSKASHSWEFMEKNFVGEKFHDTIYVTANPYVNRLDSDVFFMVENLKEDWDPDLGTVPPARVVKATERVHNQHPNKRLIVHFMQPHYPYLGDTAEKVRDRVDISGYDIGSNTDDKRTGIPWWKAVENGEISWEESINAYSETLSIVLEEVKSLLRKIDGKTIISADHGEALGEKIAPLVKRRHGHPYGFHSEPTCLVPWLEVQGGSRRNIIAEDPITFSQLDKSTVEERLEGLGYK